jgi:DNA helicase-2/ATP-dependent DNA helicase PcrA
VNVVDGLNDAQRKAVHHDNSPLLVFAGAGSGKTRVIVHRIAYLITEADLSPEKIFAVTFTNKAAGEMVDRVEQLLSSKPEGIWIGTFHASCVKILRRSGRKIGLSPRFSIYDREDALGLLKSVSKEISPGLSPREISQYLERISSLKSELVTPGEVTQKSGADSALLRDLYASYQDGLVANDALDFDDLIMYAVKLFTVDPGTLRDYQSRFSHILVDEYQDTNYAQYRLVRLLAGEGGSLFVVGDDDQSIYSWRGADIRNILEFEKDFPNAASVVLDVNYRSTGTILAAASSMISYNNGRKPKVIRAEREMGEKVTLYRAWDDRDEARRVAGVIRQAYIDDGFNFGDFAVLYRTNSQSRVIEEVLRNEGISYRVVGALSFYRRREIKDLIAYLKVMVNVSDSLSLLRIINVPPRGIGEKTVNFLEALADRSNTTLFDALSDIEAGEELKGDRLKKLMSFHTLLEELVELGGREDLPLVIREVIERTGYLQYLQGEGTAESRGRMENIDEFIRGVEEFVMDCRHRGKVARLVDFLEKTSLIDDVENLSTDPAGVSLLTLHNAKGLEFPVVFITGIEENLLPWSGNDSEFRDDVEEERRLFYVGMTRAKTRLHLSHARRRINHGRLVRSFPSRFLDEIPRELMNEVVSGELRRAAGSFRPSDRDGFDFGEDVNRFSSDEYRAYTVGDRIVHNEFGGGTVIDIVGYGESLKITVEFDYYGVKKIYPLYADLRKE